jgi:hypothetical protein
VKNRGGGSGRRDIYIYTHAVNGAKGRDNPSEFAPSPSGRNRRVHARGSMEGARLGRNARFLGVFGSLANF